MMALASPFAYHYPMISSVNDLLTVRESRRFRYCRGLARRGVAVITFLLGFAALPLPAYAQLEEDVIAPREQQSATERQRATRQTRQSNITPDAGESPVFPRGNDYILFFGRTLSGDLTEYNFGFGYNWYVEFHHRTGTASRDSSTFDLTSFGMEVDYFTGKRTDTLSGFVGLGFTLLTYAYTPGQTLSSSYANNGSGTEAYYIAGIAWQQSVFHARMQVKSTNGNYTDPSYGIGSSSFFSSYYSTVDIPIPEELKQDGTKVEFVVGLGL